MSLWDKITFRANPVVTQSSPELAAFFQSLGVSIETIDDIVVNADTALRIPALASGVNFISTTLAGLPFSLYKKTKTGREKEDSALSRLLHDAPNEEDTSFEFRRALIQSQLLTGRGLAYIERVNGTITNLWLLPTNKVTVKRIDGVKVYEFRNSSGRKIIYQSSEIIDIPFMRNDDGLGCRSVISIGQEALALCLAVTRYGATFLGNGGVPPFAVTGNFQSSGALRSAAEDLTQAIRKASKERRQALTLPAGLEIKPIGSDPEKAQMVEIQRFCVEQVARILSIPPIFLQDLTHGTYSNTEQQDLSFVKHTLKRYVEQFEQEFNLKLFGRNNNKKYVVLNVDGLLRGDYKTRMEGNSLAINSGQMTPNEARERENNPPMDGGDQLLVQSASVPLKNAGVNDGKTEQPNPGA